ncbi:biopolymer transport protein ExbD [Methylohalomonas lacus]|uniref:Biopolymer transport protein ExbD n=1 Tax=Methylohalomonas lacus TaxID=398773 RepID=A0AAE3HHQ7_9GAMM|nr:biopolymer transporter ExbD [Methylohalomonas lacus]MCS3902556.1 biopolymer transport protein ExbD [Methylohalomonas lacus]
MRPSHTQRDSTDVGVNLTPLIDMVFILLIFFLVTASFTKESGIDVDRPSAETANRQERGNLVIAISQNGEIWIDNNQVDIRSVRAHVQRLHAQNPEGTVIITADKQSRSGLMVDVMDQVRLAGVSNIAIAAKRPGTGN